MNSSQFSLLLFLAIICLPLGLTEASISVGISEYNLKNLIIVKNSDGDYDLISVARIFNEGDTTLYNVTFTWINNESYSAPKLTFQPDNFILQPDSSQKVSVLLSNENNYTNFKGEILITYQTDAITSGNPIVTTGTIPVSMSLSEPKPTIIEIPVISVILTGIDSKKVVLVFAIGLVTAFLVGLAWRKGWLTSKG